VHRKFHHHQLTFRSYYAYQENFVLPLSHDEVVHGKGSLLGKMPGDEWQRFANLRLLYAYMFALPGKKLLFMGAELAQPGEWDHDGGLELHRLQDPANAGIAALVTDLNRLYRNESALHERDADPAGFGWIEANDAEQSAYVFARYGSQTSPVLAAFNFTPVPRYDYRIGVDALGSYSEIMNTDAPQYGGTGLGNFGMVRADSQAHHGRPYSLRVTLPPLGAVFLKAPV
jgi:1,4-alpha-glucan branching enzyme